MKKQFILLAGILLFSIVGCQKDLRDDVDDLLERVAKLEKICEQANADIVDLKQIVSLLEANDYITSVNELSDKSGYAINFLKGNTIVVKHGTNGDYPVIGVDELDGVFYWTQKIGNNQASWILDSKGNKVQATGINGKTPIIGINSRGNWTVDYGEGADEILVNGKPVSAKGKDGVDGTNGKDGADGKDGANGYSPFKSVTDKGDYIELELTTGTVLHLPKENSKMMKIIFDVNEDGLIASELLPDETETVEYKIENPDPDAVIYFEATNGLVVEHDSDTRTITLIPLNFISEEGRIIASVLKDNKLISQFRYAVKIIDVKPLSEECFLTNPQPLEAIGGKVPVTINATFPANWFHKEAVVTITPVLRYAGAEAGAQPHIYQGEKVKDNNQVIPQKEGANVTMKVSFDYKPEMKKSELYLTFDVKIRNKTIKLPDIKIGEGVITVSKNILYN